MASRLIEYCNKELSFKDEYARIFGKALGYGNVFCPFHHNEHTPAGKMYGNTLHCFVCERNYSVYDLLKRFDSSRLTVIMGSGLLPDVEVKADYTAFSYPKRDELGELKVGRELFDKIAVYGESR